MICGALTWFLASEKRRKEQLENQVNEVEHQEDEVGVPLNNLELSNIACEQEEDWFAAAGAKQEARQAKLEAKQELERIAKREQRMERIKSRRNNLKQVEMEQNKDEFNELFKEVQWMKKAVERELSQGVGDEDILVEEYFSDDEKVTDDLEEQGCRICVSVSALLTGTFFILPGTFYA